MREKLCRELVDESSGRQEGLRGDEEVSAGAMVGGSSAPPGLSGDLLLQQGAARGRVRSHEVLNLVVDALSDGLVVGSGDHGVDPLGDLMHVLLTETASRCSGSSNS